VTPSQTKPRDNGEPASSTDQADPKRQNDQKDSVPQQGNQAAKEKAEDVVKISVTLVQVDAMVTNGRGEHVSDLKQSDFELLEDGRPQHITNFSYVRAAPASAGAVPAPIAGKPTGPAPPVNLKPNQVKRTIALVVDDLALSFDSVSMVR